MHQIAKTHVVSTVPRRRLMQNRARLIFDPVINHGPLRGLIQIQRGALRGIQAAGTQIILLQGRSDTIRAIQLEIVPLGLSDLVVVQTKGFVCGGGLFERDGHLLHKVARRDRVLRRAQLATHTDDDIRLPDKCLFRRRSHHRNVGAIHRQQRLHRRT